MTTTYTPAVGDIVTITPKGTAQFEILALDEIDGQMIYADRVDNPNNLPAQWYFLTYVRKVQEQEDATE